MRRILEAMATDHGYTFSQACACLAITSPGAHLRTNLEWAERALATHGTAPVGRFPARMEPACRAILQDASLAERHLRGPKVVPFYRAIAGDHTQLVLDRWAIYAGLGHGPECTATERRALAQAYAALARRRNLDVATLQATIWLHVRATTPDARGRLRKLWDITDKEV